MTGEAKASRRRLLGEVQRCKNQNSLVPIESFKRCECFFKYWFSTGLWVERGVPTHMVVDLGVLVGKTNRNIQKQLRKPF